MKNQLTRLKLNQTWPLHLFLLPGLLAVCVFRFLPMVGVSIAFQNFIPTKGFFGSQWVGLAHFRRMFLFPDTLQVFRNTLVIAVVKIITGQAAAIILALLMNEMVFRRYRKTIQTAILFPHFLSWVILGGLFVDIFSLSGGTVNNILSLVGIRPVFFLGRPGWFLAVLFSTEIWKSAGYTCIIYQAAITGIDPQQYEAAQLDGASRWKQTLHVTLPGITGIILLMSCLSVGNILNAGFDQIFNLINPIVYSVSDIIDTFVYRIGLVNAQYSMATAVGLLKSVIAMFLVMTSFRLAEKYANYQIF